MTYSTKVKIKFMWLTKLRDYKVFKSYLIETENGISSQSLLDYSIDNAQKDFNDFGTYRKVGKSDYIIRYTVIECFCNNEIEPYQVIVLNPKRLVYEYEYQEEFIKFLKEGQNK